MTRKIENEMIRAINKGETWGKDNTRVTQCIGVNRTEVYLHGHMIAIRDVTGWRFTLAGWNTRTTRSRVNALINTFVTPRAGVRTCRGDVLVTLASGSEVRMDSDDWFSVAN
jgi:intein-encoded DNA endonuclease-like protein